MNRAREAAIAEVLRWLDWAARVGRSPASVAGHVVDSAVNAYAGALVPDGEGWFDIASLPEGEHVMLFWPHGESGIGGIECATVCFGEGEWSYWTHGGPNSGLDFDPRNNERPTHWRPNPRAPKPAVVLDGSLAPLLIAGGEP